MASRIVIRLDYSNCIFSLSRIDRSTVTYSSLTSPQNGHWPSIILWIILQKCTCEEITNSSWHQSPCSAGLFKCLLNVYLGSACECARRDTDPSCFGEKILSNSQIGASTCWILLALTSVCGSRIRHDTSKQGQKRQVFPTGAHRGVGHERALN